MIHSAPCPRAVSAALTFAAGLALSQAGCAPGALGRLPPREAAELEQRSLSLLLRAAQTDLGEAQAHAIEALVEVAPREGVPIFRDALRSSVPLIRYAGCMALGAARDEAALPELRRLLGDSDRRVRLAAAHAVCRCGDERAARLLVDALNDHPDETVRSDAAYLIGRIGDKRALKRLRLAERREKSNRVLTHIYAAMALLGDDEGLRNLINAAQGDTVSRLIALQSLGEVADGAAADVLRFRVRDENDYLQTRLIAARGLGRLGSDAGQALALQALNHREENDVETLRVRENAALALGAIGRADALGPLRSMAEGEPDPRLQVAACYALLQIVRER